MSKQAKISSSFGLVSNITATEQGLPDSDLKASTNKGKKRRFLPEWQDKYEWLRSEGDGMRCHYCVSTHKTNPFTAVSGCKNYQRSALIRHQDSKDHVDSLKKIKLRSDMKISMENAVTAASSSKTDMHVFQLRTVYVMAKKNLPADVFSSLMELQELNGIGVPGEKFYSKPEVVAEMEECIYKEIESNLIKDIKSSQFVGLMLDETCDISIEKKLVVYIRFIKNGQVKVAYLGNKKVTDCTAEGIKEALLIFLEEKDIATREEFSRIAGLGTDGASVMVGCRNGLGVKLKQLNPFLIQVHCVAHRLNLAASQASRGIEYLEDYKSYIQTLYRFYSDSSVRYDKLRDLQGLLHGKVKQVPEGTSVRWLSIEAAVKMIYEYFDCIVLSLEDDKDRTGKAAGIYRFVATAKFLLCTALLIDVLVVIGILSLTFQKDLVNLSSIRQNVNVTLDTLEAMKTGSNTVDSVFADLGQPFSPANGGKYKGVEIQDNQQVRDRFVTIRENFINNLKNNLNERFPADQLNMLEALDTVFNPKRYPEQGRNLGTYGNEQLEVLIQHFLQIIDENRLRNQFLNFKYLTLSYKGSHGFEDFIELLIKDYSDVYPDLVKLASVAIVIPVSSAPCERGFSHQTVLKNKVRNRLNPERLDRLMLIKLQGPGVREMDFLAVAQAFGRMKNRKK